IELASAEVADDQRPNKAKADEERECGQEAGTKPLGFASARYDNDRAERAENIERNPNHPRPPTCNDSCEIADKDDRAPSDHNHAGGAIDRRLLDTPLNQIDLGEHGSCILGANSHGRTHTALVSA